MLNKIHYNNYTFQDKYEIYRDNLINTSLDLVYYAKQLLIEIEFDGDIKEKASKLNSLCDKFKQQMLQGME